MLHPPVAAIRAHRRLVGHHGGAIHLDVADLVTPLDSMTPEDHPVGLGAANYRTLVIHRLALEPQDRAVFLHGALEREVLLGPVTAGREVLPPVFEPPAGRSLSESQ